MWREVFERQVRSVAGVFFGPATVPGGHASVQRSARLGAQAQGAGHDARMMGQSQEDERFTPIKSEERQSRLAVYMTRPCEPRHGHDQSNSWLADGGGYLGAQEGQHDQETGATAPGEPAGLPQPGNQRLAP